MKHFLIQGAVAIVVGGAAWYAVENWFPIWLDAVILALGIAGGVAVVIYEGRQRRRLNGR